MYMIETKQLLLSKNRKLTLQLHTESMLNKKVNK